jgi:hypothetical protein
MKKWLIGAMTAVLIATCPVGAFAANGNYQNEKIEMINQIAPSDQSDQGSDPKDYPNGPHGHFRRQPKPQRQFREQEDARYIIHQTASLIYLTQRFVHFRHYAFGMATVIAHQQWAYELYWSGLYREAIFHSIRARRLAITIILRNGGNWLNLPPVWDEREGQYESMAPPDNQLDSQLNMNNIEKDEDAVNNKLNLDIAN